MSLDGIQIDYEPHYLIWEPKSVDPREAILKVYETRLLPVTSPISRNYGWKIDRFFDTVMNLHSSYAFVNAI